MHLDCAEIKLDSTTMLLSARRLIQKDTRKLIFVCRCVLDALHLYMSPFIVPTLTIVILCMSHSSELENISFSDLFADLVKNAKRPLRIFFNVSPSNYPQILKAGRIHGSRLTFCTLKMKYKTPSPTPNYTKLLTLLRSDWYV